MARQVGGSERAGWLSGGVEPGLGRYLRFAGRRRSLVVLAIAVQTFWAVGLVAIGVMPMVVYAPALFLIAYLSGCDSRTVLIVSSALEIVAVRGVAKLSARRHRLAGMYAGCMILLGLSLSPSRMSLWESLAVLLSALAVFRRVFRVASDAAFAANVRGPRPVGAGAILAPALLPFVMMAAAVGFDQLRPAIGWTFMALGLQGLRSVVADQWIPELVTKFHRADDGRRDPSKSRLGRLVRATEMSLAHDFKERGLLGYLACRVWRLLPAAKSDRSLNKLLAEWYFSNASFAAVERITATADNGVMLYLRSEALTHQGRSIDALALLAASASTFDKPAHSNPFYYLARAHAHLGRRGFDSRDYREDLATASALATKRIRDGSGSISARALAENALVEAFDIANGPFLFGSCDRRSRLLPKLQAIEEARRMAARQSVSLAAELRALEGVVHALREDYASAYDCLMKSLSLWDNLEARYYLGVLLMVGTTSFARPIYQFERVLAAAPVGSRLARLAAARLAEALAACEANVRAASSWDVFKLVSASQRHVLRAPYETPIALSIRDDAKKREVFKTVFGTSPDEAMATALVASALPKHLVDEWPDSDGDLVAEVENEGLKQLADGRH